MSQRMVINWVRPPDAVLEELIAAKRDAMVEAVQTWHSEFLPFHFREDSTSRYGFKPRSRRYLSRKRKKVGHARMLDFFGGLKKNVMGRIRITVTGAGNTARGAMTLPAGVGAYRASAVGGAFKNKKGRSMQRFSIDYNQLGDEITRVKKDEADFLAMKMQITIQNRLNALRAPRTEAY